MFPQNCSLQRCGSLCSRCADWRKGPSVTARSQVSLCSLITGDKQTTTRLERRHKVPASSKLNDLLLLVVTVLNWVDGERFGARDPAAVSMCSRSQSHGANGWCSQPLWPVVCSRQCRPNLLLLQSCAHGPDLSHWSHSTRAPLVNLTTTTSVKLLCPTRGRVSTAAIGFTFGRAPLTPRGNSPFGVTRFEYLKLNQSTSREAVL